MQQEILLVRPRGFCAGVVRAVEIVERCLRQYESPVYCKHQVVHNDRVIRHLEEKGAVFVENAMRIPEGQRVIFSAHGSPPADYALARLRSLKVIDATCPLVSKVHSETYAYAMKGYALIIVGHQGHAEVQATVSRAREMLSEALIVVEPGTQLASFPTSRAGIAVLTQTTLSQEDVAPVVRQVKEQYPDAVILDDICYATTNRQRGVKYLAEHTKYVLIVGSFQSSNSQRLVEVAQRSGCPAFLVSSDEEIPEAAMRVECVGISSGASTPESQVEEVVTALEERGFTRREVEVVAEDVTFKAPAMR